MRLRPRGGPRILKRRLMPMKKIQSRLAVNVVVVSLLAPAASFGADAQQQVALVPDEYSAWEGQWYGGEVEQLLIFDVDSAGFG